MSKSFKVVDLFAGPGGLAEGFSAYRADGRPAFEVCLSVEKEASAFATLRLRSFVRKFEGKLPQEYYQYISGLVGKSEMISRWPEQWAAACEETRQLELGTEDSKSELYPVLDGIRSGADESILIGGPPCQAYSLVGRARNRGIADYDPTLDKRHFLYREYIDIIGRLAPAAFVMENVKGFLSSKVEGERIFSRVLQDLQQAGGEPGSYEIFALSGAKKQDGREYVLRAEEFGVPQMRHRVILLGVRRDLAPTLFESVPILERQATAPSVSSVIAQMPKLRSGLSKAVDSPEAWRKAVISAFRDAANAAWEEEAEHLDNVALRLSEYAEILEKLDQLPPRGSDTLAPVASNALSDWLIDPNLKTLPNHQARTHMSSDLTRYAFAATFAEITGRSAKANDFPNAIAPKHQNWKSGKFSDRFRVQHWNAPATTITSHISKDGHYFIHPDPLQCRSLTVREAARIQTFPDNYLFEGNRTNQYTQVGNAVPPLLALQIASVVYNVLTRGSGKG